MRTVKRPTRVVLTILLDRGEDEVWGRLICQLTGLETGTVHPMLARLEKRGWVESRWETPDQRELNRPMRRYYKLTELGIKSAREILHRN